MPTSWRRILDLGHC